MDTDKNGTIDFKEFISFQAASKPSCVEDVVRITFDLYDRDGDGTLTRTELIETMTNMLKAKGLYANDDFKDLIMTRVNAIMESVDVDNDEHLSKEEIIKACTKDKSLLAFFK
jgi:Ca2+-binding EF-hand superfamily protein